MAHRLAKVRYAAPGVLGGDGAEWTAEGFNKWRERVFVATIRAVGLDHARPYDLRHSFASLLLHEGRSVIYVARQLGHGADLTLGTYGHTIDELDDAPRLGADEAIAAARATLGAGGPSELSTTLDPGEGRVRLGRVRP